MHAAPTNARGLIGFHFMEETRNTPKQSHVDQEQLSIIVSIGEIILLHGYTVKLVNQNS